MPNTQTPADPARTPQEAPGSATPDQWAAPVPPAEPKLATPADEVEPTADGAPHDAEHPRTTWICENSRCKHHRKRREVNAQHLGQGLYLMGPVVCICGRMPVKEIRR